MKRYAVVVLAGVPALAGAPAIANANVEVGGTAGLHAFSDSSNAGFVSGPMETTQKNSALFGLRVGYYFTDKMGVELEGGLIPNEPRKVLFDIWNVSPRVNVVYQFRTDKPDNLVIPFLLAGAGVLAVVDSNNTDIIKKDTEPMFHIGGGVKYHTTGDWGVRFDARTLLGKANDSGVAFDFELLASLYHEFGRHKVAKVVVDEDPDHDGIVGAADKCPKEPEDKDGFQDEDGCPDPDNDGDGIADADDKCPTEAEDKDGFQDDDGCPDPDNDNDGVPDAVDKCPDQPETKNGYQDEDGCPDEVPAKLAQFTGAIQGITFKTGSADLAQASNKTLDKAVAVLTEFKDTKLEIQGHTDDVQIKNSKKFPDNDALSQARADSVKAYFVKKGIDEARLSAKGYGSTVPVVDPTGLKGGKLDAARAKNRRVEFKLVSPQDAAGGAAPATTPTPAPTSAPATTPAPATTAPAATAPAPAATAPAATPPAATAPTAPKADAPKADAPKK